MREFKDSLTGAGERRDGERQAERLEA
jgi:hypothetical protein